MNGQQYQLPYDDNYEDWKAGDKIVWEEEPDATPFAIIRIAHGYVYWHDADDNAACEGSPCTRANHHHMTRETNMLRVKDMSE